MLPIVFKAIAAPMENARLSLVDAVRAMAPPTASACTVDLSIASTTTVLPDSTSEPFTMAADVSIAILFHDPDAAPAMVFVLPPLPAEEAPAIAPAMPVMSISGSDSARISTGPSERIAESLT